MSVGGPLTAEMLIDLFKRVEADDEVDPCKVGHHLVSSTGAGHLRRGGFARCANCAGVLQVRDGSVEVLGF